VKGKKDPARSIYRRIWSYKRNWSTNMFNPDYFKVLIREVTEVREVEIGCDECFEQLDRFVEMRLSGLDTAEAMPLVQEHLGMCGECREEFEALLAALRATSEA
jgi:hypothetical protein